MKNLLKTDDEGNVLAEIFIGQNAAENVKLFDEMNENDLWFHLAGSPSSHVWLQYKVPEKKLSLSVRKNLVKECARLVGENSKCSFHYKVNYLEKKHLSRDKEKLGTVYLKKKPECLSL